MAKRMITLLKSTSYRCQCGALAIYETGNSRRLCRDCAEAYVQGWNDYHKEFGRY